MKVLVVSRKIILSILMMMVVLGVETVGYSQAVCQVGDIIQPGERCTYPGTNDVFSVDAAGRARFLFFTAGGNLILRDSSINGRRYTLVTEHSAGGGRRITELGGATAPQQPEQSVFVPNRFAEEYVVRQIYFYPSNREPPQDIDATLDKVVEDVQKFYADEMERHGFGRKTFRIETDAAGNQVRQHIRGRYTNADYWINRTNRAGDEAINVDPWGQRFINLVYYDRNNPISIGSVVGGVAGTNYAGAHGGNAQIWLTNFDEGNFDNVGTTDYLDLFKVVAHELGHTFGLSHDFRDERDIMNYGGALSTPARLSYSAAEWLDVTHYFNTTQSTVKHRPTIEMLSPTFISPPNTIRLRFSISHTERIHQVQLATNSLIHSGTDSVIDHKSIKGDTNTVEFVTDKLSLETIEVSLYVIDEHGNFGIDVFPVDITTLIPDSEPISIPDTNLAAAIRENFDLAPGSTITRLHMAGLQKLHAHDKQITDITGLEYATNLVGLHLGFNKITDLSPLAELTQLETLSLEGNNISDISLLTRLTNLADLDLSSTNISDISPLAGLTKLRILSLGGNNISDISPLTRLANLIWLYLNHNHISDISPLTELTQLETLWLHGHPRSRLEGNNISDISPLTRLTNLTELHLNDNHISDISPLTELTRLRILYLAHNDISDISPLTRLTHLTSLDLLGNTISDVSALVKLNLTGTKWDSTGLDVRWNPLSAASINTHIPAMQAKGIEVKFDDNLPTVTAARPAWDVNGDGITDGTDIILVGAALGQKDPQNPRLDVNGDGVVDGKDLALVAEHLGEGNASAGPSHPTLPLGFTLENVEHVLNILRAADDGTLTFKRGIENLEQLLALFVPENTTLLPNYPNPFNPETWIPYQLAKPASVTLHIYAVNGALVRTLALGHQPAGVYRIRSRAAYWDGRNAVGEPVASGLYFYTLSAGDFTATRKMLIRK